MRYTEKVNRLVKQKYTNSSKSSMYASVVVDPSVSILMKITIKHVKATVNQNMTAIAMYFLRLLISSFTYSV